MSDTAVHRDVPRPPSEERRGIAAKLWRFGLPVALLAAAIARGDLEATKRHLRVRFKMSEVDALAMDGK